MADGFSDTPLPRVRYAKFGEDLKEVVGVLTGISVGRFGNYEYSFSTVGGERLVVSSRGDLDGLRLGEQAGKLIKVAHEGTIKSRNGRQMAHFSLYPFIGKPSLAVQQLIPELGRIGPIVPPPLPPKVEDVTDGPASFSDVGEDDGMGF